MEKLRDEGAVVLDRGRRSAIYKEVVEILDKELPVIWLIMAPYAYVHRAVVKDFATDSQGLFFSGDHGLPYAKLEQR
jgi:ABC-type transport system substrate-binding protein